MALIASVATFPISIETRRRPCSPSAEQIRYVTAEQLVRVQIPTSPPAPAKLAVNVSCDTAGIHRRGEKAPVRDCRRSPREVAAPWWFARTLQHPGSFQLPTHISECAIPPARDVSPRVLSTSPHPEVRWHSFCSGLPGRRGATSHCSSAVFDSFPLGVALPHPQNRAAYLGSWTTTSAPRTSTSAGPRHTRFAPRSRARHRALDARAASVRAPSATSPTSLGHSLHRAWYSEPRRWCISPFDRLAVEQLVTSLM